MAPERRPRRHKFWRLLRIYFRRFRITVWLVVLAVVGLAVYLNQIGLPDFLKDPLLENLRSRGVNLQFSRLRVQWHEGIVAENVHFGTPGATNRPQVVAREVELQVDPFSLLRGRPQIEALSVRHGRMAWPVFDTNQPNRYITAEEIQTDLRFLTNDVWVLDNFRAVFAGANIRLSGFVTNASAIPNWSFLRSREASPGMVVGDRLRHFADTLESIQFAQPPELNLSLDGDALDLQSFSVRLLVAAAGASTPWGDFNQGRLSVRLLPATNSISVAEVKLEAEDARTPWAVATNLNLRLWLDSAAQQTNLVHCRLELAAGHALTRWAQGKGARLNADWVHCLTNPIPLVGEGTLQCDLATNHWGQLTNGLFHAHFKNLGIAPGAPDPALGWWTNIQPYYLDWSAHADGASNGRFAIQQVDSSGSWTGSQLVVSNLSATVGGRAFECDARLDVGSRLAKARIKSGLDPHDIAELLPPEAARHLDAFAWSRPPEIAGTFSAVLPAWTNPAPDWRQEVQPTLAVDASVTFRSGGAYRGVAVSSLAARLNYSNQVLWVPDLVVERPEGRLVALLRADERTRDAYWKVASTIDPTAVRPLVQTNQQGIFELLQIGQAPEVEVEGWIQGGDAKTLGFRGRAAVTNVTFRGEHADAVVAAFDYTNQVLKVFEPRVWSGVQHLAADGVLADFNADRIYLTNGVGLADPMFVTRAIGAHVARAIEAYRFDGPVSARVSGIIPMHGEEGADVVFKIDGGPFHWWRFNLPRISGTVHWGGLNLKLNDVRADFYGGQAEGRAEFDLREKGVTKYKFVAQATNVVLQGMVKDVFPSTRGLEGLLNATLVVTHANSAITNDVQGYGQAELRDGLIWNIPLFGVFTPLFNGISPGLGNSRATSANCSFDMTNAVLYSSDLVIRSQGFRLKYNGSLDLEGRTAARAEAEMLRDVWLFGPLVSTVLRPLTKMFEYKVSGTISEPKLEPVYVLPRLMLMPFQPVRTIKGLFQGVPSTNAPPEFAPRPPGQ